MHDIGNCVRIGRVVEDLYTTAKHHKKIDRTLALGEQQGALVEMLNLPEFANPIDVFLTQTGERVPIITGGRSRLGPAHLVIVWHERS